MTYDVHSEGFSYKTGEGVYTDRGLPKITDSSTLIDNSSELFDSDKFFISGIVIAIILKGILIAKIYNLL